MAKLSLNIPTEVPRTIVTLLRAIVDFINGRLDPATNFQQYIESDVTPGIANSEFVVYHGLARAFTGTGPNGNEPGVEMTYILDGPGTLYASNKHLWNENEIRLRCSDAGRGYTIVLR